MDPMRVHRYLVAHPCANPDISGLCASSDMLSYLLDCTRKIAAAGVSVGIAALGAELSRLR